MERLKPCKSEQCYRLVSLVAEYCCFYCAQAWEATSRYEPHEHTTMCNERYQNRTWIEGELT